MIPFRAEGILRIGKISHVSLIILERKINLFPRVILPGITGEAHGD
jgi:hypothetical protein